MIKKYHKKHLNQKISMKFFSRKSIFRNPKNTKKKSFGMLSANHSLKNKENIGLNRTEENIDLEMRKIAETINQEIMKMIVGNTSQEITITITTKEIEIITKEKRKKPMSRENKIKELKVSQLKLMSVISDEQ
jgi:hypothetical protein